MVMVHELSLHFPDTPATVAATFRHAIACQAIVSVDVTRTSSDF